MKTKQNIKISVLTLLFSLCILFSAHSQVTIGSDTEPLKGSLLDLKEKDADNGGTNSDKGMTLPRVSLTDRYNLYPMFDGTEPDYETLKSSHTGLIVYNVNTTAPFEMGLYLWNGTQWDRTTTSPLPEAYWSLNGNAGTTGSNFIGTTDASPLIFKVNNEMAGFIGNDYYQNVSFGFQANSSNTGSANSTFGFRALSENAGGSVNIAFGALALENNTYGNGNVAVGFSASANKAGSVSNTVAIGSKALFNNQKDYNTAVGFEAATNNTTGEAITAVGSEALWNNSTGGANSAFGYKTLYNNTTASHNTAVGVNALYSNTTGPYNTAVGVDALFSNTTADYNAAFGYKALENNTEGVWGTALGALALNKNTTGVFNTAGGYMSMYSNKTGNDNTAFGVEALKGNVETSRNTAIGYRAMWSSTPEGEPYGQGESNVAVGYEALREIVTGSNNVGIGKHALMVNSTGNDNASVGNEALYANTSGSGNTAVGAEALKNNTTGSFNTAVGYKADISAGDFTNATAIGYGAKATASNQVVIGNSDVTSISGAVPFTTTSDRRIKKNIQPNVPGLEFINLLQPVTYHLERDINNNKLLTGFIAQDVEKAAQSIGYDFFGVDVPENASGLYGLRYELFVVPLVKAVQELSQQSDTKDAAIASLQQRLIELENTKNATIITSLRNRVNELTEVVNRLLE